MSRMTTDQALEILQDFNDYRRNVGIYDVDEPCEPKFSALEIGQAIDAAIAMLTPAEHMIDRAEQFGDEVYRDAKVDFNITDKPWDPYHMGYLDALEKEVAGAFVQGAIYERATKQRPA